MPLSKCLSLFLMATLTLTACSQTPGPTRSSDRAQFDPEQTGEAIPAGDLEEVEILIWAQAPRREHWRADGPVRAAEQVTDFKIKAHAEGYNIITADDYVEQFTQAAAAGKGPDIALAGAGRVLMWAGAGYIVPLDECQARYPEFDDVMDDLWRLVTWQGELWGVPMDIGVHLLYFNKPKLQELGWSDERIAALSERIKDGQFTLDDLVATAQEAIEKGVVEPGFGYWPGLHKSNDFLHTYVAYGGRFYDSNRDKLVVVKEAVQQTYAFQRRVMEEGITLDNFMGKHDTWINRLVWRDTVAHGRVLFWKGATWEWSKLAAEHVAERGGRDYLSDVVGYALWPSGLKGQPGSAPASSSFYMITSEKVSGRNNRDAACAVLAKTTTPEINAMHAVESTQLGVLKSQADHPVYTRDRFISETLYMLDYAWYVPNHVGYRTYVNVVSDFSIKAESGEILPSEAADAAIGLLQDELGDAIIVE